MKPHLAVVVAILSSSLTLHTQQKETSKPSLEQTIAWMENLSRAHGFMYTGNQLVRDNFITGVKRCNIIVEVHFSHSTKSSEVKNQTATIFLTDFSPSSVREITDKDDGTYRVDFERSDSDHKTEAFMEMGDGSKTKMFLAEEWLFFDSEESAKRFAHALSYAITSCGGKSSAF